MNNIDIFNHTMSIFENYGEEMVKLKEVRVLLPEDIRKISKEVVDGVKEISVDCKITCDDADTYTMACRIIEEYGLDKDKPECMVLNFANPYIPGGGVRRGANAQEENLCRRSSLLLSLESEEAKAYYRFNKKYTKKDLFLNDYGTNSLMINPYVEVIKDKEYNLLEKSVKVAVMTAAAPIIKVKAFVSDSYVDFMYDKINSLLVCAAHYGYKHLVLGAWGCGAFGNDPDEISRLFKDVINNFRYGGKTVQQLFERISFAVPYNEKKPANYLMFMKQFGEA